MNCLWLKKASNLWSHTRGLGSVKSSAVWNKSEEKKKVTSLEFLAEKLIKFNVHTQNKTFFLVVRNELLFPQKTHFTEEGDITFTQWLVTCIKARNVVVLGVYAVAWP
jgi:hypothetical protein